MVWGPNIKAIGGCQILMLSLFQTRDLYETGAFYRIEKKYREPKLWSFEVWPFSVKYGFYKAISIVIWGSFWLFLTHFWPFFPENSGLDVLNGAFYMSTYAFYILQQKKVVGNTDFGKNLAFRAKFARKSTSRWQNPNFLKITKNVTTQA